MSQGYFGLAVDTATLRDVSTQVQSDEAKIHARSFLWTLTVRYHKFSLGRCVEREHCLTGEYTTRRLAPALSLPRWHCERHAWRAVSCLMRSTRCRVGPAPSLLWCVHPFCSTCDKMSAEIRLDGGVDMSRGGEGDKMRGVWEVTTAAGITVLQTTLHFLCLSLRWTAHDHQHDRQLHMPVGCTSMCTKGFGVSVE